MKIWWRKIRNRLSARKNFWRYFAGVLLVVILVLAGYSGKVYLAEGREGLIRTPIGRTLLGPYHLLRKSPDLLYLGYEFKRHNLPVYRLEIVPADWRFLNDNLPEPYLADRASRLTDEFREKVPAKFYFNGQEYKVKVSYRGYVGNHWANAKKSWDIKFDQDNLFNGLTGLKLIIPEDRGIVAEHFNNYRNRKLGLPALTSSFVVLEVNGRNHGVYFQLEPWDKNFLVQNELIDETDMFAFNEDWNRQDRISDSYELLGYYEKQADSPLYQKSNFAPLDRLIDLVNNAADERLAREIGDILDLENFWRWQVAHQLAFSPHNVYRNIRLFTDRETGKLVFVPWDIGYLNDDSVTEWAGTSLYRRLYANSEWSYRRNQLLWEYVGKEENLADDLKFYDQSFAEIKTALAQDHRKLYSTKWFIDKYRLIRDDLIDNFNRWRELLADTRATITVYWENNQPVYFDVVADMLPEIAVSELEIDGSATATYRLFYDQNGNQVMDGGDTLIGASRYDTAKEQHLLNTDRKIVLSARKELTDGYKFDYYPQKYRFFLQATVAAEKIKIKVINAVTGDKADKLVQDVNLDAYRHLALKRLSVDEFIAANPAFRKVDDRTVKLNAGSYAFVKDIIIPAGVKLVIDPGARLLFAPDVSLVSYGAISAQGRPAAPIYFAGSTSESWGVVAIGEGNEESIFTHVIFRGGSDALINGVYYSGMLSAYRSAITIDQTEFSGAVADDAVNVKHARALITNSTFLNNSADAIDLDFVKAGRVAGNKFLNNGNDGVDLSGATVVASDNYFENSGDKGVSVGENSPGSVIYNNVFKNNLIGVEVKDLSEVYILNNLFLENGTAVNAYRKKEIFGGGFARVYNSIFWNNGQDLATDELSEITVANSNIASLDGQNDNFYFDPQLAVTTNDRFTIMPKNGNILFVQGGNRQVLRDKIGLEREMVPVGLIR